MTQIKDVLYIKTLELRLRRRLNEDELDGNPFLAKFPDGHWEELCVPYLKFPTDLLPTPDDYIDELIQRYLQAA